MLVETSRAGAPPRVPLTYTTLTTNLTDLLNTRQREQGDEEDEEAADLEGVRPRAAALQVCGVVPRVVHERHAGDQLPQRVSCWKPFRWREVPSSKPGRP